jgi:hypothetical protein
VERKPHYYSQSERERRELGEIFKAVEETGVESTISGERP